MLFNEPATEDAIDITDVADIFQVLSVIGTLSPWVPTNGLLLALIAKILDRSIQYVLSMVAL